jgi:hypothetical protein
MTPRLAFRALGAATDRRPAGASLPFKHGICRPQTALETDAILPSLSPTLPPITPNSCGGVSSIGAMIRRNSGFTDKGKKKKKKKNRWALAARAYLTRKPWWVPARLGKRGRLGCVWREAKWEPGKWETTGWIPALGI